MIMINQLFLIKFIRKKSFLSLFLFFLVSYFAHSQSTLTGSVQDEEGMPIPGVSVIEKNTENGTVTDFDGNFQLNATSENPVLTFSFV